MQLRGSVQRLAARSHDFLDAHRVRLDPDAQHADLAGSREVLDALRDECVKLTADPKNGAQQGRRQQPARFAAKL